MHGKINPLFGGFVITVRPSLQNTLVIDSLHIICISATILIYCEAMCTEMVASDLVVMAIVKSVHECADQQPHFFDGGGLHSSSTLSTSVSSAREHQMIIS